MKVVVHMLSQSYPIDTRDPDWRWRNMCAVLAVGFSRGFRFITVLWVAHEASIRSYYFWVACYQLLVNTRGVYPYVVMGCPCVGYAIVF